MGGLTRSIGMGTGKLPAWKEYQEEVAEFFRAIGLEAKANQTLAGVRTTHDVDVVVRSKHVGFQLLWVVECKRWRTRVSKLHVLALRQIVIDLGADRGMLMTEAGLQSGAIAAAELTNVEVNSLAQLRDTTGPALGHVQLRGLLARVNHCRERYWNYGNECPPGFGPVEVRVGTDWTTTSASNH